MTQEKRTNHMSAEPDWADLIRTELDSYVPERLPARFAPRPTLPRRHAPRPGWRFVAIALAVFMLGFISATLLRGPIYIYQMAPNGTVSTPTPPPSPSPTPVPTQQPTAPQTPGAPATTAPRGQGAPPAATTAPQQAAPPAAPAAPAQAPAAPAPTPTPSGGVCLLGAVCVGIK